MAEAARAGDDQLTQVLRHRHPFIRWWLRRTIGDCIRWADLAVADRSDRSHVLRLAFLCEARLLDDIDCEDRTAVARRFVAATADLDESPSRPWTLPLFLLGTAGFLLLALTAMPRAKGARFSPLDAPLGATLGTTVPEYAVEVLRASRFASEISEDLPRSTDRATELRDRALKVVQGSEDPVLALDLTALLDSYDAVAVSPRGALPTEALHALSGALQRLNARLHQHGRPFFLDMLRDRAAGTLLLSYYVLRETVIRAEGDSFRLVRVRRLDSLRRDPLLVGYTRAEINTAVVLLDMLERQLLTVVFPALARGGTPELVDLASLEVEEEWPEALAKRAAEIMREDLRPSRFSNGAGMARLASLLARRRQIVANLAPDAAFRDSFEVRSDDSAVPPSRLLLHPDLEKWKGRAPRAVLRAWEEIEGELDTDAMRRTFAEIVDRFAVAVDMHEIQHQIDFRRGLIPVPPELRELLGVPETVDLRPTSLAVRCRDELSAILSSVASADEMPRTHLTLALEPVFNRALWATPHAVSAAVILEGLAQELGEPPGEPMTSPGGVDRRRATELYLAIMRHDEHALILAARRLWERFFQARFPRAEFAPWRVWEAWNP
ncbi:MAG TPA: hypothetical protein VK550_08725 [Polyangiaceae bacterium]|nr:hypothetical protein [Polyangiaceae bacterium]